MSEPKEKMTIAITDDDGNYRAFFVTEEGIDILDDLQELKEKWLDQDWAGTKYEYYTLDDLIDEMLCELSKTHKIAYPNMIEFEI